MDAKHQRILDELLAVRRRLKSHEEGFLTNVKNNFPNPTPGQIDWLEAIYTRVIEGKTPAAEKNEWQAGKVKGVKGESGWQVSVNGRTMEGFMSKKVAEQVVKFLRLNQKKIGTALNPGERKF
ncbi:MAG: hypothetical protein IH951_11665 [Bacteroidetes bacterium]|nr:hypothetical protein [Bacteroidota bacterium]